MTLKHLFAGLVVGAATMAAVDSAQATIPGHVAARFSGWYPWHGEHYHPVYKQPLALVVPPTAGNSTEYAWGVGNTRITPTYHQFQRPYPGPFGGSEMGFRPVPAWPSSTTQFGVHYIRGPW